MKNHINQQLAILTGNIEEMLATDDTITSLQKMKAVFQDAEELLRLVCDYNAETAYPVQFQQIREDIQYLDQSDEIGQMIKEAEEANDEDDYDPVKEHGTWNRIGTGVK
jgi:3-methyladenine DNA glycosylase Tag